MTCGVVARAPKTGKSSLWRSLTVSKSEKKESARKQHTLLRLAYLTLVFGIFFAQWLKQGHSAAPFGDDLANAPAEWASACSHGSALPATLLSHSVSTATYNYNLGETDRDAD
jgi:hypothetical protein